MKRPLIVSRLLLIVAMFGSPAFASKVETWRKEGPSAFSKGTKDKTVVSDLGRVRLSRGFITTKGIACARVWDLARATARFTRRRGTPGRFSRKGGEAWKEIYKCEDTQALSIVVAPGDKVSRERGRRGRSFA